MKERVGQCHSCQKEVYCVMGFFQGIIDNSGQVYCFDCYEKINKGSDIK
jgi:hypothetical protein